MTLYLKNGNFYRGKELVQPEFGNVEQIECLRRHERLTEELNGDGHPLEFDYEPKCESSAFFRCLCGGGIFIEAEGDDEYDCDDNAIGLIKKCRNCDEVYEIGRNKENEMFIKIKKSQTKEPLVK